MSYPPVFDIAKGSAAVVALLGTTPIRLWPFARAPQKGKPNYGVPYAVHQLVYGTPANTLSCPPDRDNIGIQFDCYAATDDEARALSDVLRDAYELSHNPVVSFNGEEQDAATNLYRVGFTVEFWPERATS